MENFIDKKKNILSESLTILEKNKTNCIYNQFRPQDLLMILKLSDFFTFSKWVNNF